ncbi:MAG: hypothetical protein GC159_15630 [Phycisphaera sp.]|nr:hypothetical protein [Phycisphaera sp.]
MLSWIPLVLIAKRRASHSPMPRVHIFQDMDAQPKFGAQDANTLFADGRAMRPVVEGAVARGHLNTDDHYYRGYKTDGNLKPILDSNNQLTWYDGFPKQITVDMALLKRGQERFNIYCAVCHGRAGYGDGSVSEHIKQINDQATFAGKPLPAAGWVPPRNLIGTEYVRTDPLGKLFNTITNGFNKMPSYAAQIPVEDRWAIVAYVHALINSQRIDKAKVADLYKDEDFADPLVVPTVPKVKVVEVAADASEDEKLIAQGATLFQTKICFTCHTIDASKPAATEAALHAPRFIGKFWGEDVKVHDGINGPLITVKFDEAYFMESVEQPMAKIVDGALPGMAPLPTTPEERKALMYYVRSLSK